MVLPGAQLRRGQSSLREACRNYLNFDFTKISLRHKSIISKF
jgi:hypothetical protein